MILSCAAAQTFVNEASQQAQGPGRQALIDFIDDSGGRIGASRVWYSAQEPPQDTIFQVLKPIRLHYATRASNGTISLCAETCDDQRATRLEGMGAGVGTLSIRAQLYRHHRHDPQSVQAIPRA